MKLLPLLFRCIANERKITLLTVPARFFWGRLQADRRVYAECTWHLEHSEPEEFEYTYQRAKDARNAFLKARKRLDAHIEEHRCER